MLLVDWSVLTSVRLKQNSKIKWRNQTLRKEIDNNYHLVKEDLNSNIATQIIRKSERNEEDHLFSALGNEYSLSEQQMTGIESQLLQRNKSKGNIDDIKHKLDKRFIDQKTFNETNDNIEDELQSAEAQNIFAQNELEEREHVFDALNDDYSYEEKQLRQEQTEIMKKLINNKPHQHNHGGDSHEDEMHPIEKGMPEGDSIKRNVLTGVIKSHKKNHITESLNDKSTLHEQFLHDIASQLEKKSVASEMKKKQNQKIKKILRHDIAADFEQKGVTSESSEKTNHIISESSEKTNHTIDKRLADTGITESLQDDFTL